MSDRMTPLSMAQLMDWVQTEYREDGKIFGVARHHLHHANPRRRLDLFGEHLETPFGPAAGPHTQLAQNIIAAYVAGARFFELKTVQIIDGEDLPVAKPCIDARDECYNVEWSTELRVPQAQDEYIKAWFVLKLLAKEYGLGSPDGFIFNMSVGYDLAGIQSPKIDGYIENMKDAARTAIWAECTDWLLAHLDRFEQVDQAYAETISPQVCRSITLSTLHGCPPQEIERIAHYLLTQKNLHTFIKCNPTMLGYEYARQEADRHGFDYVAFDDHHFKEDLQFEDAVPMLKRLQAEAAARNLQFGVKLTNTFPVDNDGKVLPGQEMYMSGRSLFPFSLALARRLSEAFNGQLRISYSGGADARNLSALYNCGIWPITVATTLLKVGGYQRLRQLASLSDSLTYAPFAGVDNRRLEHLLAEASQDAHYQKAVKLPQSRKLKETVPYFDCFTAPCRGGCPIHQDIPAYLRLVAAERYQEALEVILERNPLPYITGTVCAHPCMTKCTRGFYESSVNIRGAKLEAAREAYEEVLPAYQDRIQKDRPRTAVIGAGPGGIAAAHFLARSGYPVTVFEREQTAGGVVRHVVPEFRIPSDWVERDVELARRLGATFVFGQPAPDVATLRAQGFTYVIFATGAQAPGVLRLQAGEAVNAIEFLRQRRREPDINPYGRHIVVAGGGNTAMDCARSALRLQGVASVTIVYRRDKRNMPADAEELELAVNDGAVLAECLAPEALKDGQLTLRVMKLGAAGPDGRRRPEPTEAVRVMPADTLIAAVGEKVDPADFAASGIDMDSRGRVICQDNLETSLKGVYVVGDAHRGPATIVEAIADATTVAKAICGFNPEQYLGQNTNPDGRKVLDKRAALILNEADFGQAGACLECQTICECCVDVCPNRANITVRSGGHLQIVHLDPLCNECGNCETFCPYSSAPYRDKFTFFASERDFADSENAGFVFLDADCHQVRLRWRGQVSDFALTAKTKACPPEVRNLMLDFIKERAYCLPG
ncbi:MAG: putative selenate reductase subunit YgfK [Oscillospiraceae bacterium]|nr:putative selenate reductase subunit YgfK [Oscillospiraceae bacterium]MDD4368359.1 putative selenate reductase subunit YgfK [Oscillospiraceae bacterium]